MAAKVGEAAVASEVLALARNGVLDQVGFVKAGLAESFTALGYPAAYVPNRAPDLPTYEPYDAGPGLNVGVFAEPFWRKNVVTQLGAVALLDTVLVRYIEADVYHAVLENLASEHAARMIAMKNLVIGNGDNHRNSLLFCQKIIHHEIRTTIIYPVGRQIAAPTYKIEHRIGFVAVVSRRRVNIHLALAVCHV